MDSKHRHELEQNALAKWLVAQYEDWIRPNSSWLGYAVLGVLAVVCIIFGTTRLNAWNQHKAWKQYYAALHSEQAESELEMIANSSTGIVSAHARLALAQRLLYEGTTQVSVDKTLSIVVLEKAIASFQQAQSAANDPHIAQMAGFGLGQCWETLAAVRIGDDLAKAKEEYQKIVDRWGDSTAGQRAKDQLTLLQQPTTEAFLALSAAKTKTTESSSSGLEDFMTGFGQNGLYPSSPLKFETGPKVEEQKNEPGDAGPDGAEKNTTSESNEK